MLRSKLGFSTMRRVATPTPLVVVVGCANQTRCKAVLGASKLWNEQWHLNYPERIIERNRNMYTSFYPYLFDHGDKMSLYPKIPSNPREWQPNQLLQTYDAVREDRYDAFLRIREKFPELYEDTLPWDNPPPFGEFNMHYSVRFGLVGTKIAVTKEYDSHGNGHDVSVLWVADNQVVGHSGDTAKHVHKLTVGAMNVPPEFHRPDVALKYKRNGVPVKHVSHTFHVTPDAYVPIGTKLDVRHFKVGQEVDVTYQDYDFGFQGVVARFGFDGGPKWMGCKRWNRRPGSIGQEGMKRVSKGQRMPGQTGGAKRWIPNLNIYRIDYKNSLVYVDGDLPCEPGTYVTIQDSVQSRARVHWNENRGLPVFPTFIPKPDENIDAMATEDCQLVTPPLWDHLRDDFQHVERIGQRDLEEGRQVQQQAAPPKQKLYDYSKIVTAKAERQKARKKSMQKLVAAKQVALKERLIRATREKFARRRKVK